MKRISILSPDFHGFSLRWRLSPDFLSPDFLSGSVYIVLKPGLNVPQKVKDIASAYKAVFDVGPKGVLLHFQAVIWEGTDEDSSTVESFLATLPKADFLFLNVRSLDDIQVAGSYFEHPYKDVLPRNLVEFLEEEF